MIRMTKGVERREAARKALRSYQRRLVTELVLLGFFAIMAIIGIVVFAKIDLRPL